MIVKILIVAFLSVTAASSHITKEAAVERCASTVEFLENSLKTREFVDPIVQNFFPVFLTKVKNILDKLKKSENPKDIFELRKSCDNSLKAASWLFGNFAYNDKKTEEASQSSQNEQPQLNSLINVNTHTHTHSHSHDKATEAPAKPK